MKSKLTIPELKKTIIALQKDRDELLNLLSDLLAVADSDPELAQYPAARATRDLLAERLPKEEPC